MINAANDGNAREAAKGALSSAIQACNNADTSRSSLRHSRPRRSVAPSARSRTTVALWLITVPLLDGAGTGALTTSRAGPISRAELGQLQRKPRRLCRSAAFAILAECGDGMFSLMVKLPPKKYPKSQSGERNCDERTWPRKSLTHQRARRGPIEGKETTRMIWNPPRGPWRHPIRVGGN